MTWLTSGLTACSLDRALSMQKAVKNETALLPPHLLPHEGYLSSLGSLSSPARLPLGLRILSAKVISRWAAEGDQEPSLSSAPLVSLFVFSRPRLFLLLSRASWLAEFDQEGSTMKLSVLPAHLPLWLRLRLLLPAPASLLRCLLRIPVRVRWRPC